MNKKTKEKISKNKMDDILLDFIQELRLKFKEKILNEYRKDDIYSIELASLLNKFEINKLMRNKNDNLTLEIAENVENKKSVLSIWKN